MCPICKQNLAASFAKDPILSTRRSMDQLNLTVVTSNVSSPIYPPLTTSVLFRLVIFSLCLLVGVPGNIAVIILKPNWNNLSHLTRSLMLNLTVSDLLCLLTIPFWIYTSFFGWTFSLTACKLLVYFQHCTISASLLTVTVLSIQRYFVIVLQRRCHQLLDKVLLVLLWLAALILIYVLVTEQLLKEGQWIRCIPQYSSEAQWLAVLFTEILFGLASCSLVTLSYISLHKKVRSSVFFNHPETSRLLISIILSNFIMFFPLYMVNMLAVLGIILKNKELLKFCADSWSVVKSFTFTNSTINPLLYAFISTKFCPFCTKNSSNTDERTPRNT
uniref:G-protein coupled receptors family 1 profile domain-containing protein n=1 Tax=Poecilia mexicana TaxID=48701 RepID=A0A3B3YWS6_9TELE